MTRAILSATRHGAARRSVALALFLLLPACYRYVPLESGEPRAGQEVRVRLTDETARDAALPMRGSDDGYLTGLVLGSRDGSLTLSTRGLSARRSAIGAASLRDTLTLARSSIQEIEESRLDPVRTTILAGLGAGAVAGVVILVANTSLDNSGTGGGGGKGQASVEIPIRIPVGSP